MANISDRLSKVIEDKCITKYEISTKTGISESILSRIVSGETQKPQEKTLKKIAEYLQISPEWLLTGKGEMSYNKQLIHATHSNQGIPLIPIEAMAGYGIGDTQVLEHECDRYVVPVFKDAEFLIQVKGSSMIPKYNSGDIVACRKLPLDGLFFQWNKVYVLDTIQGALIKRVKAGSDANHLLIVSDNERYEPFELHISQIRSVAIVIGVIRLE